MNSLYKLLFLPLALTATQPAMADDNNAAATDSISSTIRTTPIAADNLANKAIADSLSQSLREVVVTADVVNTTGNTTRYKITKQMRRGTISTAEMLGNLPNFEYEPSTRSVKYNNSSSIAVLIDGLEKQVGDVLELQHLRFDHIEVTNSPQGKYQGYDVLIEFFTKEDYEGYEGQIGQAVTMKINSGEDKLGYYNPFGYFAYTKNKWTFDVHAGHSWGSAAFDKYSMTHYTASGMTETLLQMPGGPRNYNSVYHLGTVTVSLDYMIDPKSSVSIVYKLAQDGTREHFDQTFRRTFDDGNLEETFRRDTRTWNSSNDHTIGIFYRNDRGRVHFNADFNYRFNPQHQTNSVWEQAGTIIDNYFDDNMNFTQFRLSGWTALSNNKFVIDFGYTNTWKDYDRKDKYTGQQLNTNSYLRNRLYAGLQLNAGRFSANLSPWIEQIHIKSGSLSDNQLPVGTSLMLFYQLTQKNWMRFNYNCSTDYPDLSMSNSYGYFSNPLIWREGNPMLKSSITHSLSYWLDLLWCFNFQCGATFQPDLFAQIADLRTGQLPSGATGPYIAYTYQNVDRKNYWASVSFTKRLWKNFIYKADFRYDWAKASYGPYRNHDYGINFWTSINYYNHQYKLDIRAKYSYSRSVTVRPQLKYLNIFEYPELSITKRMMGDNLSLSLAYGIMFNLFNPKSETKEKAPGLESYDLDKLFDRERNRLMVTLVYRFNGGKSVRQYQRDLAGEK